MRPTLYFTLGPTNVGKSTILEAAGKIPPVGLIEVGKMLRAKYLEPTSKFYDPDFFKGQAAPTHTAKEAWKLMEDGVEDTIEAGKNILFIDGQPRDVDQCDQVYNCYQSMADRYNVIYLNLFARLETRIARAKKRDTDEAKLKLSMARMENDCIKIYEVLSRVLARNGRILTIVTDHPLFDPTLAAEHLVRNARMTAPAFIGNYTNNVE
jgi:hypothetical protein